MKTTVKVEAKVCTKCEIEKSIEDFRIHKKGFVLNQCKECERKASNKRRLANAIKKSLIEVITKSGKVVEAYTRKVEGGRKAYSSNTDKVLFFAPGVNRDSARIAFSAFAGLPTTGIKCPLV